MGKQRLFLSYGHDEFEDLATRLVEDLLATQRYEVWFDKHDILPGSQWEHEIQKGVVWVAEGPSKGWVILLMTPHSVRLPDGYCLREIEYARTKDLQIVPIMVITVELPISINLTQYLDMTDCIPVSEKPGNYRSAFERLCAALDKHDLAVAGETNRLRRALRPPSCRGDAIYDSSHFVQRRGLLHAFDDWIADPDGPRVFWVTGSVGTGKSTWAAWLSENRSEVKAFHVCGCLDLPNADYRVAVRSIAWQLSTALPGYAEQLNAIAELESLLGDPDVDLLDRLFVQPMRGLSAPGRPVVVLMDALDEASTANVNLLAELLGRGIERLPRWIRFALTSAPDPKVLVPLREWKPLEIVSGSEENVEEILEYLEKYVAPLSPAGTLEAGVRERLLAVSECNWLYLGWVRRSLERGRLTLQTVDEFPQGLGGVCHHEFVRRFAEQERYRSLARPFLSVLAAAGEPLPLAEYALVLKRPEADVKDVIRDLAGLVGVREGRVRPFHYALVAWLVDEAQSGAHSVSVADGHRALAEDGWAQLERDPGAMRPYARAHLPRHLAESGQLDRLERCVTDARFIAARVADGTLYELARHWTRTAPARLRRLCEASHADLRRSRVDDAVAYAAALGTGQLFQQSGLYDPAIAYFEKALRAARRTGNATLVGQAELNIGWCLRHVDEFERAIEHSDEAIKRFREGGSREGQARALSVRGMCRWHLREDLAALGDLGVAKRLFEECGDDRNLAEVLNHLGIVRRSLGMYEEALAALRDSKALSTRFRDSKGLGKCLNSLGTALWWKGDLDAALECYREADLVNEEVNQPYVLGLTANNRGYVHLDQARYEQAYESFERARAIRSKLGIVSYEMLDVSGMALASHHLGRAAEARRLSTLALSRLRRFTSVEDLERAYYNHYVITKEGAASDRAAGQRALRRAVALVSARMRRITDETIRARFREVPLVKEVLAAARTVPPPKKKGRGAANLRTKKRPLGARASARSGQTP